MTDEATGAVTTSLRKVASALPSGGESRPGQESMAEAVGDSMARGRHLVVQAGTGTGKSLAYLVPAALSGHKVVVATATKALQDQLANKDLPLIASTVADQLTFALLKGRSNYVCRQRVTEVGGRGVQTTMTAGNESDPGAEGTDSNDADRAPDPATMADQVRALVAWADTTTSGDRAELAFEPDHRAWAMVSTTARECPGAFRCPSGRDCFAEHARARAAEADIVVVNTHLYGAHLASGGAVLPEHQVVIFDEAHEVEDVMTDSLGVDIGPGRFTSLAQSARALVGDDPSSASAVATVAELADLLTRVLRPWAGRRVPADVLADPGGVDLGAQDPPREPEARGETTGPATLTDAASAPGSAAESPAEPEGLDLGLAPVVRRTRRPPSPPASPASGSPGVASITSTSPGISQSASTDPPLGTVLALATGRIGRLIDHLRRAERAAGDDGPSDERSRRDRVLLAAGHLAADLARLALLNDGEVAWVDEGSRTLALRVSPVDVAPLLSEQLWGSVTAILTSATVPLGLPERLGMPTEQTDDLDVGSPFDYRAHALLYVASSLPDRRSPEAETAIHAELETLINAAGGRTLALFTSWRAMRSAAEALAERLDVPVLTQSDLPKTALVEAFAADESACLFATLGFWQGVDVPGRTLSLVTIDRIPFPRPDDPVLDARRDLAGAGAFGSVDLPRAGTLLAQGAGRLIRTINDRGVVAVLDSRLAKARYRGALLARVPPMRRTIDQGEVTAFLSDLAADR